MTGATHQAGRDGSRMEMRDRVRRLAGGCFITMGVLGTVTGLIPWAVNLMRILDGNRTGVPDLFSHGVEGMGLSLDWALLSSAEGTFLGILLILAGMGWLRKRAWAWMVTFLYGLNGVLVTGSDLLIFWKRAHPGPMRVLMLSADGLAFGVAVSAWLWLGVWALWHEEEHEEE